MNRLMHSLLFIVSLCIAIVAGDFTPTAPGPGDIFKSGSDCTIEWIPGIWPNVTIALMTGSNNNMQLLTTVVTGLNGSDPALTPYNWTCPKVVPNAPIYFYQFTNGDDISGSTWTTRFTIASESGSTSLPENSTQPNGDAIPWGTGALQSSSANDTTSQSITGNTDSYDPTSTGDYPISSSRMVKIHKPNFNDATSTERQAAPTINVPSSFTMRITRPTPTSDVPTLAVVLPEVQAASGASGLKRIPMFSILTIVTCILRII